MIMPFQNLFKRHVSAEETGRDSLEVNSGDSLNGEGVG